MPPAYGNIKTLHAGKHEKGIILRLLRKYEVPDFYGGNQPISLECIFHDEESDRIHASIGKTNIEKYSKVLQEGSVYSIVEFVVGANRMKIRTTSGEHKMMIIKCTRIFEIYREEFPSFMFEFKTFAEVKAMDNNAPTFDVLAIVVCSYKPQMINCSGKVKKMMKMVLEDLEGQTIRCTLWERYAEQMIEFIQTGPEAPPGIILQFCTTNIFKGEVELQNCYDTTRLIFEQTQEEIKDYKAKYFSKNGKDKETSISTITASTTSEKSIVEEHKDGDVQLKTLTEIQSQCEYLSNKAASMMGTTSRYITLQTPEPHAITVFYEYRVVGQSSRPSIMIRLTDGWSEVAEQLQLERGNAVRLKKCDKLQDCFHIIHIPIIKIDINGQCI